jgi:IPT/TIG domain
MLRRVPFVIVVLCCTLAVALVAGSAGLARQPKPPEVKSISPKRLSIGDTLTIRGRNFVPGKFKNAVAFQRPRAKAVFLMADSATRTTLRIKLTSKLLPFLSTRGGEAQPTRFSIRVLSRRFGVAFTPKRLSPVIGPGKGPLPGVSADCDRDKVPNSQEEDDDNDLLTDVKETSVRLDGCNPDTDRDGMEDGWEYYSALDLNSKALPYPGKRPYPNPLDGSDAGQDHDGDGLTELDEYSAWIRYGAHNISPGGDLLYSDGTQNSDGGPKPVPPGKPWLDIDADGSLSDDERDVEGDGLSNWIEVHGYGVPNWWTEIYKEEKPYTTPYPALDWLDGDTDGDTVPDGDDDQDHDDVNNVQETIGGRVGTGLYGIRSRDIFIHPYNPCLPNWRSRTCSKHPPIPNKSYPPFDENTPQPLPTLPYGGDVDPQLHWPIDWP